MLENDNAEIARLTNERDQLRSRIKEIAHRLHILRMRKRRATNAEVPFSIEEFLGNLEK